MNSKNLRGLLIKVDFMTGERAGGIDPKDKNLRCHGWQNLNTGFEIRLIEDDRDLSQYDGVDGVEVLIGKDKINQAIRAIKPQVEEYVISNEAIMLKHMEEKKISLDCLCEKNRDKLTLKELYDKGIAGISKDNNSCVEV